MARFANILSVSFAFLLLCGIASAQWISFTDETATRFSYASTTTDPH